MTLFQFCAVCVDQCCVGSTVASSCRIHSMYIRRICTGQTMQQRKVQAKASYQQPYNSSRGAYTGNDSCQPCTALLSLSPTHSSYQLGHPSDGPNEGSQGQRAIKSAHWLTSNDHLRQGHSPNSNVQFWLRCPQHGHALYKSLTGNFYWDTTPQFRHLEKCVAGQYGTVDQCRWQCDKYMMSLGQLPVGIMQTQAPSNSPPFVPRRVRRCNPRS